MDTANYVDKVGKLINNHTKYSVKLDKTAITNTVLIKHLQYVYDRALNDFYNGALSEILTLEEIERINHYIHCLKKEIKFYPEKVIDPDCIMTEVNKHIIQE